MKKAWSAGLLASAALITGVLAFGGSAEAQFRPSPSPSFTVAPSFNCGVTISAATGLATIVKTNAVTVGKTSPVVAVIRTPKGDVDATVCGSAFTSSNTAQVPFKKPQTNDTEYIYTCTAKVVPGACPTVK